MKKIVLYFLLILFAPIGAFTSCNVKQFLASLPAEERIFLDYFFRRMIQEDCIGYVLLGEKPMGFYSYLKAKPVNIMPDPIDGIYAFFNGFEKNNYLFQRGCEVWQKYKSSFTGKNIFFDAFDQDDVIHYSKVIVMNKKVLKPLLKLHLKKFISLDSSLKDSTCLFDALLYNNSIKEKFYVRHDLLGICLGYGERNAVLFQKISKLVGQIGYFGPQLAEFSPCRLEILENEIKKIKKHFKTGMKICKSNKFSFSYGVGFRADYLDPETEMLR